MQAGAALRMRAEEQDTRADTLRRPGPLTRILLFWESELSEEADAEKEEEEELLSDNCVRWVHDKI